MIMSKEKEYDITGAARYLNISKQAVSKHVNDGHIETVWRGHLGGAGKRMIKEVDLLVFIWSDYYTGREGWERRQAKDNNNE